MDNSQQSTSWGLPDATPSPVVELPDLSSPSDYCVYPSSSSSSPPIPSSGIQHHQRTTTVTTATYQPPPTRYSPPTFPVPGHNSSLSSTPNIQQQRCQLLRSPSDTADGVKSWLEPEPPSPGASTLVDTPPAAHLDSLQFPSRSGTPSPSSRGMTSGGSGQRLFSPASSMSQSQSQQSNTTMRPMTSTTTETSAFIASTSLSTTSPFNRRSSEEDPSSFVPIQLEPMSTSKKDNDDEWRNAEHNHHHGLTTVVTMHGDMTPSRMSGEQSYCPKHNRHDSCGGGANASHSLHSGGGGGRYTPSVAGSSNSVRTLLPGVGSSSSTGSRSFFGSLLVPWQRRPFSGSYSNSPISLTSSTATLIPPVGTATVSDVPSNNNNNNHPDISPTGKVYMKRPKAKVLGGTAKDAASKTKGNGTRTALFSNERTFLHWIRFGILLGSLSLTLLNFGQPGSLGFYVGTVLLCIAMLVLVYASATFHFRDRLLSHKLKAQTLQIELRKQISSEPGALTAARIAEVSGTTAATGEAGPATIITVEQRRSKKKKGRESASTMTVQARIDKLKRRAEEGRYYDRIGPSIVTGALIIAYSFNLYLSVVNPPSDLLAHATGTSFFGRQ